MKRGCTYIDIPWKKHKKRRWKRCACDFFMWIYLKIIREVKQENREEKYCPKEGISWNLMERSEGLVAFLLKQFVETRWLTWVKNGYVGWECSVNTINVTGETLVSNKIFPGFMLRKSLLYAATNPIFPTFLHCKHDWWNSGATLDFSWLYAGKILALCWHKPYFPNFSSLMLGKSLLYAGKILF